MKSRLGKIIKTDFHLPKKVAFNLSQLKPFKNDEKCFSFHVGNPFSSWDIYIFVVTFCHEGKQLDKKTRVNSKIYDNTSAKQIITIRILSNSSGSKGNKSMKFGKLIEFNMRNNFFQKIVLKMWRWISHPFSKGTLSSLRQITASFLKMMTNVFIQSRFKSRLFGLHVFFAFFKK